VVLYNDVPSHLLEDTPKAKSPCHVGDCNRPVYCKLLCRAHYIRGRRAKRAGCSRKETLRRVLSPIGEPASKAYASRVDPPPAPCEVRLCLQPVMAKGFCRRHYYQMWRFNGRLRDTAPPSALTAPAAPIESTKFAQPLVKALLDDEGPAIISCCIPDCIHPIVDEEEQLCAVHVREMDELLGLDTGEGGP
jgi:hypothetical protein